MIASVDAESSKRKPPMGSSTSAKRTSTSSFVCGCQTLIFIIISILCALGLLIVGIERNLLNYFVPSSGLPKMSRYTVPLAISKKSIDGAAFVFLGLGPQAYQMNCPAAVESLVKHGGWGGDVYLITDRESCFDSEQIVRNAGMEKDKFHLEVLDEDFGGGGIDVTNPQTAFIKNRMRSKSMKTHLFDIVSDPAIEIIAYADCDVLFGVEGCPNEFITNGEPWDRAALQFTRVDLNDAGRMVGLHAGTIVMHREYSKEALRLWGEELEKGDSTLDRVPYLTAYERLQNEIDARAGAAQIRSNNSYININNKNTSSGAERNPMFPGQTLWKAADGSTRHFENFVQPDAASPHCINHISKARCDAHGREKIQEFVDRFEELKSYEGNVKYCPSPVLQPMLYGWFPFSYLPWCPKIEKYL